MWSKDKWFSVKRWADKEIMVYKLKEIFVTIKKNEICGKVDAIRNHAKQNKPDSEIQLNIFSHMQKLNVNFHVYMCMYIHKK